MPGNDEYISKFIAEKRFHDWMDGFSADSRFLMLNEFDGSFNLTTPDRKEHKISETQITLSPIDIESRRLISQKDIRQGALR